ncbi:MAG: hypothetical protein QG608_3595 [Actinomycetota bacterium]|nr:hypothetical protein [Actinomycetota bacterium]
MGGNKSGSMTPVWFCAVSQAPGNRDRVISPQPEEGESITTSETGDLHLSACGEQFLAPRGGPDSFRLLGPVPRLHERELSEEDTHDLLGREDPGQLLAGVLPPFAAVRWDRGHGLLAAVDPLGLRHLYHRRTPWDAALATSPLPLVRNGLFELDRIALGTQTLLGWQLGDRSPFEGVRVVPPGAVVRLHEGRLRGLPPAEPATSQTSPDDEGPLCLDTAVRRGAILLRTWMESFLGGHPDAVLQLSGGLDSRLLLAAVPPSDRRNLTALTLGRPGEPDLDIAAALTARYDMNHEIIDCAGLGDLTPERAHELVTRAALELNCSADPLAQAANAWAETGSDSRLRLAGVGGEAGRGLYYTGRPRSVPVTRQRVERLAVWRLFTNNSVPTECLDPDFATTSRETTLRDLHELLSSYSHDWNTATDEFCLRQFERRWAGLLTSSTCFARRTVDPLFDDRYLARARRLPPRDKHQGRYCARLIAALDEDLARIPLENRPAPQAYARPSVLNKTRVLSSTGRTILGKIHQRALGSRLPFVGGTVLAALLAEYYREHPEPLWEIQRLQIFRSEWLEDLAVGSTALSPSAAAMLVNLQTLLSQQTNSFTP